MSTPSFLRVDVRLAWSRDLGRGFQWKPWLLCIPLLWGPNSSTHLPYGTVLGKWILTELRLFREFFLDTYICTCVCHVKKLEYDEYSYQNVCAICKLSSLSGRRKYFDLLFLFKSVNAYYDCQPFFGLHVPGRSTRQTRTFHEPGGRINFSKNVLFNRIPTLFNQYSLSMRVFNISLSIFKNNVKNVFF